MKKLIVRFGVNDFVNIPCDRIFQDANFLYGYRGDDLVCIFSIGAFDCAYISEAKHE